MNDTLMTLDQLVEQYAARMRRDCRVGGELGYAHAFVEALTDPQARFSNADRLLKVRAVNAAATLVRAERQPTVQINAQHSRREG